MKMSNMIIFYLIIVFPLFIFAQWRAEDTNTFAKANNSYEWAMTAATHDAVEQLRLNAKPNYEYGYSSTKFSRINKEPAFETFIDTLSLNFGSEDDVTKELLGRYIPVFGVLEYDGFSLNVYQKYINGNETLFDRVWLPKIPFAYSDVKGNIIKFTLDEYVIVFDAGLNEWIEGDRRELLNDEEISIELLKDADTFDKIRRDTIVNTMQNQLAYRINEHNVYTKSLGITYTFTLPLIAQEDWYNTIDDVSVIAFFQGYPYERGGGTFNEYALAGSRLVKQDMFHATTVNSQKIFYAESCNFNYSVLEIYPSKKDAAKAGYFEKSCLNQ
ncbi:MULTISPECIES: hypothetical protein [unclassified Sporosarcina]|uniref:hypothetical protein n=1 Tax=unclassified Sporosarcina TaxID=2647733 RepID=UPI001A910288|nr:MULTISPECIES: hypothetical protein [unclassified Sporosarcina]MBO0589273.1 hypothetical protein [Sporosarcina sp. E16_8]MBO0601980.1 hypothetical protein [Sporosarcina sp. E16_3]